VIWGDSYERIVWRYQSGN